MAQQDRRWAAKAAGVGVGAAVCAAGLLLGGGGRAGAVAGDPPAQTPTPPSSAPAPAAPKPLPEVERKFPVTSKAFSHGEQMPKRHTVDGEDVSPPLAWSDLPEGTRELAIVSVDPGVRRPTGWVHWVAYGISPDVKELPEALPREGELKKPVRMRQGKTSWGTVGYRGPAGRRGAEHRYTFRVYALDRPLEFAPGADLQQLIEAMEGRVIGMGEIVGVNVR